MLCVCVHKYINYRRREQGEAWKDLEEGKGIGQNYVIIF